MNTILQETVKHIHNSAASQLFRFIDAIVRQNVALATYTRIPKHKVIFLIPRFALDTSLSKSLVADLSTLNPILQKIGGFTLETAPKHIVSLMDEQAFIGPFFVNSHSIDINSYLQSPLHHAFRGK